MYKQIVVGSFQFLGFHLCKALLNEGNEVLGIDWKNNEDTAFEEKYMEIGRNDNFSFISFDECKINGPINIDQGSTIYISYYDYYKIQAQSIIDSIPEFIKVKESENNRLILFLPIESEGKNELTLTFPIIDKMVLLPTLYGPWQPNKMAFQAGIDGRKGEELTSIVQHEYREDAIFIQDFIDELSTILSNSDPTVHVQSSEYDQWWACAREIFEEAYINNWREDKNDSIDIDRSIKIKVKTTPKDGILQQMEHYRKLQFLSNLNMG